MFWNDIADIKNQLKTMKRSIDELHCKMFQRAPTCQCKTSMCVKECGVVTEENECEPERLEHIESMIEVIKENIEDTLGDCDNNEIGLIHDKLNQLLSDEKRMEAVLISQKVLDKFEDYMKNVDKLNLMINEMKGLVAVARACLNDKKEFDEILENIRKVASTATAHHEASKKNMEYAITLHNQHFKIDALYRNLVEIQERKTKLKKPIKKKASSS